VPHVENPSSGELDNFFEARESWVRFLAIRLREAMMIRCLISPSKTIRKARSLLFTTFA